MDLYFMCTTDEAFEDQLTKQKTYKAVDMGISSIKIKNDKGDEKWYGLQKFVYEEETTKAMAHG